MESDNQILEILLELAEDENKDLRNENDILFSYVHYLEQKNRDLIRQYNNLVDIRKRLN